MSMWRPRVLPLAILAMAALLLTRGLLLHEGLSNPASAQAPAGAPDADPASANLGRPVAGTPGNPGRVPVPPPEPPPPAPPDEVQVAERALLESLRERRLALDAREAEIAQREMLLAATERRVAARIADLGVLQQRLEAETAAQDERAEQRLRQLVRLYEAMRPRDASAIFNELDMEVLLPVLARMREARAAPILAAMQPERARQATTELARMRARLAP
jgi:flagellar motility protein MotE (MotC chaperone)